MLKNYNNLFSVITPPDPADDLLAKIMEKIQYRQKVMKVRSRLVIFSVGLIGSIAGFIPVFKLFTSGLNNSGFFQFFSLLFTDSQIILTYWDNFLLTLLEALPIFSLTALLIILFVFLESLKNFVHDLKIILPNRHKILN
jgi:hypothetical protein